MNLYGYCEGGPAGRSDPLGLCAENPHGWPKENERRCRELFDLMDELTDELASRWQQMYVDEHELFEYHRNKKQAHPKFGSWDGHQKRYYADQKRMNSAVDEYTKKCGGPPGPRYRDANGKRAPSRPNNGTWWDPNNTDYEPYPWYHGMLPRTRIIPIPPIFPIPIGRRPGFGY